MKIMRSLLILLTIQNFEETDWYILRKAERNIDIPSEITTERNNLFAELETKENEINALTNKADIITYGS